MVLLDMFLIYTTILRKNKKRRIRGFEGTLSNLVYKIRGFDT